MSNTPKTDALFFPHGRDHTAAAEPSLLVCMTQYELLERENAALRGQLQKETQRRFDGNEIASKEHREEVAALRDWGEPVAWCWMDEIGFGLPPDAVSQEATLLYAKKEEGR